SPALKFFSASGRVGRSPPFSKGELFRWGLGATLDMGVAWARTQHHIPDESHCRASPDPP
ncbi:MAG: hypothetical protein ACREP7_22925, partial [Lysobacter sp.]